MSRKRIINVHSGLLGRSHSVVVHAAILRQIEAGGKKAYTLPGGDDEAKKLASLYQPEAIEDERL